MSKKNATKNKRSEALQLQLVRSTKELVRPHLLQTVIALGLEEILKIVEEDRTRLCGAARYNRDDMRRAYRAGTAPSELVLGGRRVSVPRPRVRNDDGEVELPMWKQFAAEDPLEERAMEQMLVGVATRKYKRSLEDVGDAVKTRGTSRSAVSRRFVVGTEKRVKNLLGRDLSELDIVTLMLDGMECGEHVVLVALGIDAKGEKHVLGLQEGATENSTACKRLLNNLRERGFRTDRSLLVVIDGSKALRKAVSDVFGKRAVVQRCQEHKIRNVTELLPQDMKVMVRRSMQDAYRSNDRNRAKKLLENLARTLEAAHPGSAASLREGLDETLTVVAMNLSSTLTRTLATTNPIENLNGRVRQISRNVKRWHNGNMVLRWAAAGLLEAEKTFRRIRGHRDMPRLVAALRHCDAALDDTLVPADDVA